MKIKFKISSKNNVYGEFKENKKTRAFVIFLSGFSGSSDLPLFDKMQNKFYNQGFSTLRFSFCNDIDGSIKYKKAFELESISFDVYNAVLKIIFQYFEKKHNKFILIGHSFGAPIFLSFLNKHRQYLKKSNLVLWDPSILPWPKKVIDKALIFDVERNLYIWKHDKEKINEVLYKEVLKIDTVDLVRRLGKDICIIGADNNVKKYTPALRTKNSNVYLVKHTDHFFKGNKAKKELFEKTLRFIMR